MIGSEVGQSTDAVVVSFTSSAVATGAHCNVRHHNIFTEIELSYDLTQTQNRSIRTLLPSQSLDAALKKCTTKANITRKEIT